ncbi:MAG: hypothetical protein WC974_02145 [Thermoplasmata archaeon]
MPYKIPSDMEVLEAILSVKQYVGMVGTQEKFRELVQKELKDINPAYTITGERLRKIAISSGLVDIHSHVRESGTTGTMRVCPVCGSKVTAVKNMTIGGGKITSGFVCNRCKYWTGRSKRTPTKHVFTFRKSDRKLKKEFFEYDNK